MYTLASIVPCRLCDLPNLTASLGVGKEPTDNVANVPMNSRVRNAFDVRLCPLPLPYQQNAPILPTGSDTVNGLAISTTSDYLIVSSPPMPAGVASIAPFVWPLVCAMGVSLPEVLSLEPESSGTRWVTGRSAGGSALATCLATSTMSPLTDDSSADPAVSAAAFAVPVDFAVLGLEPLLLGTGFLT